MKFYKFIDNVAAVYYCYVWTVMKQSFEQSSCFDCTLWKGFTITLPYVKSPTQMLTVQVFETAFPAEPKEIFLSKFYETFYETSFFSFCVIILLTFTYTATISTSFIAFLSFILLRSVRKCKQYCLLIITCS
jgi:hypothetical protein